MTAMLLALVFSESALSQADEPHYRIFEEQEESRSAPQADGRPWSPNVEWKDEEADCPIFFRRDIDGFGTLSVHPRCREDDGLPHAL
jgi:hypothetical protein